MAGMNRIWLPVVALLTLTVWACGQEKTEQPVITVTKAEPVIPDFPPPVTVQNDRSAWREAQYGSSPIILTTEKKMPNTGERVPDNARQYIDLNDTWAANLGEDLQMVLNLITYKPEIPLDFQRIAGFAADQFKGDPAVSGLASRAGTLTIPGAEQSHRMDGTLFRDGLIHYFAIATARKGQTIWQLTMLYPETYKAGPGDVEYILSSLRVPE